MGCPFIVARVLYALHLPMSLHTTPLPPPVSSSSTFITGLIWELISWCINSFIHSFILYLFNRCLSALIVSLPSQGCSGRTSSHCHLAGSTIILKVLDNYPWARLCRSEPHITWCDILSATAIPHVLLSCPHSHHIKCTDTLLENLPTVCLCFFFFPGEDCLPLVMPSPFTWVTDSTFSPIFGNFAL